MKENKNCTEIYNKAMKLLEYNNGLAEAFRTFMRYEKCKQR